MPSFTTTEGDTQVAIPEYPEFNVQPIEGVDFVAGSEAAVAANLARYQQAFGLGMGYAEQLSSWYIPRMQSQINEMAPFIRGHITDDNLFNQQQRLQAVEAALPGARQITLDALGRAQTLASGRLLSSIDDRAFETVSRNTSADSTFLRGFGDDSVFGRKTSDIISAKERLQLSMMGEGLLQSWLQQGNAMFVDQPIKSDIGSQIPLLPVNEPAAALGIASFLGGANMLPVTAQPEADLKTQMFNSNLELEAYYASVAAEQAVTNAWQGAFNADASFAQQQLALETQLAAQQDAADQAAVGQALGFGSSLALAAAIAF